MRCRPRIRSASSSVVPIGRGDETFGRHRRRGWGDRRSRSNCRSRLVMMPDQAAVGVDDRHAGDLEARHQRHRFTQRGVRRERDGIEDHPALGTLHAIDLGRLPIDRHVLVEHADAAGARHRDRHLRLGHGVHRRRDERHVQRDAAREARRRVDVLGMGAPSARGTRRTSSKVSAGDSRMRRTGAAPFPRMRDGPLSVAGDAGRMCDRLLLAMAEVRRRAMRTQGAGVPPCLAVPGVGGTGGSDCPGEGPPVAAQRPRTRRRPSRVRGNRHCPGTSRR